MMNAFSVVSADMEKAGLHIDVEYLNKLEEVFKRIQDANLRINAEKSFFAKLEVEYLGFKIDRKGIRPITRKVEAIQALQPPTTCKQLRRFIGIINYYRDMWPRRSEVLAPLSKLTSKTAPFKWTVQAPHSPIPHPYFVPFKAASSRKYHSKG